MVVFTENFLQVSNLHKIYYATAGNRSGIPLLKIHGGPGSCCKIDFFNEIDLNKFFVIIYDQRGCGKSLPAGELKENNTEELIEDINKLLQYLQVEKVVINGASWGACLALLFAEKYPEKVIKLFLNSVFLANKDNNVWFYEYSKNIFPDVYEKYMSFISNDIENKSKYMFEQIMSNNIKLQQKIAYNLTNYELNLMSGNFNMKEFVKLEDVDENVVNSAKIFLYYESNSYFIEDEYILKYADNLKNIPMVVYHGRLDMDCPLSNVYKLKELLPEIRFNVIPYENHCGPLQKQLVYGDINNLIL